MDIRIRKPPQTAPGTSLEKMVTGISGFDTISGGGLPRGRTTLIVGSPGSGKTLFALQTLVHGASVLNEPGIFVAFEESPRQVFENAAACGWDLAALQQRKLFFLDGRLSTAVVAAGEFDVLGLLAQISAKAKEIAARRVVFDGIDVPLQLLGDEKLERREIYRIHEWLGTSGLTGIVTAKGGPGGETAPRNSFLQFMADCVIRVDQPSLKNISARTLQIAKYRGSSHSRNEAPLIIGGRGLEVIVPEGGELEHQTHRDRVSTGSTRLDSMLEGGFHRGSSVLVSGSPGTAKTTIGGAFVSAACSRGERALFVSFDESATQIRRNLGSVGIPLERHVRSGLLAMASFVGRTRSPEEHIENVCALLTRHRATFLVVDPISAIVPTEMESLANAAVELLIDFCKRRGITVLSTSLLSRTDATVEATIAGISTIVDTWIHLSYVVQAGERNRALTIVKSRGTAHSNQVREMELGRHGIDLKEVYTAGGEVLLGTRRWEREEAARRAAIEVDEARERRRREIASEMSHARAEVDSLRRDLATKAEELARLATKKDADLQGLKNTEAELRLRRGADPAPRSGPRPSRKSR